MEDLSTERVGGRPYSPPVPQSVERQILDAVGAIRYGSVVVTVQDGRVVQIESTEKLRIHGS